MNDETKIIPPHGGYQKLKSYQMAEIVYDATVRFCMLFLDRRSRTVDQMVQAARSGKQNIVEGSMASGTSKKNGIEAYWSGKGEPRGVTERLQGINSRGCRECDYLCYSSDKLLVRPTTPPTRAPVP